MGRGISFQKLMAQGARCTTFFLNVGTQCGYQAASTTCRHAMKWQRMACNRAPKKTCNLATICDGMLYPVEGWCAQLAAIVFLLTRCHCVRRSKECCLRKK